MSDAVDKDSKTEEATPKRLADMREKGQVVKSADVAGAATVVAATLTLMMLGDSMSVRLFGFARRVFSLRDPHQPLEALEAASQLLVSVIVPVAGAAAIGAIAVTMAQTKGLFTLANLAPKPERFDVVEGMKKVLPGPRMAVETGKSLLKVGVVALLVYRVISSHLPEFAVLPSAEPEHAAYEVASIAGRLVIWGVVALALLAGVDYFIAWRRFQKDSMMAKHEVKQEHKEAEGDPRLKAKRRAKAREVSKNRAVASVQEATCLVTNPTHISVALRYDPGAGDGAPVLLAHGVEEVALRMRVEARKQGVPIIENKPLARALRSTGKVGQPIPIDLYEAAARVIAHVMSMRAGDET